MARQNIESFVAEGLAEWHSFAHGRITRRDAELAELEALRKKAAIEPAAYTGWNPWSKLVSRITINRRASRLARRIRNLDYSTRDTAETLTRRARRSRARLVEAIFRASDVSVLVKNRDYERGVEQPDQMARMCRYVSEELRWVNRALSNVDAALKASEAGAETPPPSGAGLDLPIPPASERVSDEIKRLSVSLRNLSGSFRSDFVEYPSSDSLRSLTDKFRALDLHNLAHKAEDLTPETVAKALPLIRQRMDKLAHLIEIAPPILEAERKKAGLEQIAFADSLLIEQARQTNDQSIAENLVATAYPDRS